MIADVSSTADLDSCVDGKAPVSTYNMNEDEHYHDLLSDGDREDADIDVETHEFEFILPWCIHTAF